MAALINFLLLLAIYLGLGLVLVLVSVVVHGAPIPAPDISICMPPSYILPEENVVSCCPPQSPRPAVPYTLPKVTTLKVRRAAHQLDDAYVAKLVKAYDLMKALPEDDPRSFFQQAKIHCAYCNQVYLQRNTSIPFNIHATWLFFPFHRWYLYFHERILANLLNDSTFALTYWGYDRFEGSSMPEPFIKHSTLFNENREKSHFPPAVVDILQPLFKLNLSREEQVRENEYQLYRVVVSGARTTSLFMGKPYRFGGTMFTGLGTVELRPHNSVHLWTGDSSQPGHKDMGAFFAAARDPIFYTHHSFLDRLFTIWTSLPSHQAYDDPDFLDTEFTFYDENAQLVNVKVRDCLVDEKMGYVYEPVDNPWLNAKPHRVTKHAVTEVPPGYLQCKVGEAETMEAKSCTIMVLRDPTVEYERMEEVLVVQNPVDIGYNLYVFINYPDANAHMVQSNVTEFVGPILSNKGTLNDPETRSNGTHTQPLGIGFHIKELGLSQYQHVAVTFVAVPRNGSSVSFTISNIWMEYEPISSPPMEATTTYIKNQKRSYAS